MNEEVRYSNRELDHFLTDIKSQLNRIEEQTTRTNGRTTRNENDISKINTKINTTILVGGVMLPMIISLVTWIFVNQLDGIKRAIPSIVSESLADYEFEIVE